MKAWLVTMGCPKNLVDSEATLTLLRRHGCTQAQSPGESDVLLVNACSFLDASWRETVEEARELSRYRNEKRKLVMMGCLPRHRQENLEVELPFVDHFLPTGAHGQLPSLITRWTDGIPVDRTIVDDGSARFAGFTGRDLLTGPQAAYVKIAEGCNRRCTFCAIPAIRGRQVVRPVTAIVDEVAEMAGRGVREVTLLAQDIVSYSDNGRRVHDLVGAISDTGVDWIRIFYVHPAGLSVDFLERLLSIRGVVPYLEMPVQHASTRILERMRRSHSNEHARKLISAVRHRVPEVVIRSEVIVGFPGETDADFDELNDFVQEMEFDSLGVFPYSAEPGTEAATMAHAVPGDVIKSRVGTIIDLQEAISFGARSRFVGQTLPVLVEREVEPGELEGFQVAGRFYGQAPEVDGEVYIQGGGVKTGGFVNVRIEDAGAYDLSGLAV